MRKIYLVVISVAIVLAMVLALVACSTSEARPQQGKNWTPGLDRQPGTYGPGGGMGPGMMGPGGWGRYNPDAEQLTIDQTAEAVEFYIQAYEQDLTLVEIMEFGRNFYAEIEEESTGIHAMELLIDKYTGRVYPEMGPNMMWNTRYGMHAYSSGGESAGEMRITPETAERLAQQFLDANMPGVTAGEAETFYGYYTLHTLRSGQIEGMLSVNGTTGAVWYHSWHGPFIDMKEFGDEDGDHH